MRRPPLSCAPGRHSTVIPIVWKITFETVALWREAGGSEKRGPDRWMTHQRASGRKETLNPYRDGAHLIRRQASTHLLCHGLQTVAQQVCGTTGCFLPQTAESRPLVRYSDGSRGRTGTNTEHGERGR